MVPSPFTGKQILVLGGTAHEMIDGVRCYANHGRSEFHGLQVARHLSQMGAAVTLITTASHSRDMEQMRVIRHTVSGTPITDTQDMLTVTRNAMTLASYDVVCCLVNIPSVTAARPSPHKLKVKAQAGTHVVMDIKGNLDIEANLLELAPTSVIAGYNSWQEWFSQGPQQLIEPLQAVITQADQPEASPADSAMFTSIDTLKNRKIIVSSGPTSEKLSLTGDVITNLSSGRQGYAIATALAAMGASVTLISGSVSLAAPSHPAIVTLQVSNAQEMLDTVLKQLPADGYIGVAAVADFGLNPPLPLRLKPGEPATIHLRQNPDILQTVATHSSLRPAIVVGFAAETHDLELYARGKLEKKGADAICANLIGSAHGGNTNQIMWVTHEHTETWDKMDKYEIGLRIGQTIAPWLNTQDPTKI